VSRAIKKDSVRKKKERNRGYVVGGVGVEMGIEIREGYWLSKLLLNMFRLCVHLRQCMKVWGMRRKGKMPTLSHSKEERDKDII
jgi:hypothetical protein